MSMNTPPRQTSHLKREILVRVIKAYLSDNFEENTRLIPYAMRPKGSEVPFRCCIHKERAILRDRTIATLGMSIEDADDSVLLSDYAKQALERTEPETDPLTVLTTACKGCVPSRMYVTDLCQGCVARSCTNVCKFGAISIQNGRAVVDSAKCKNCGMCIQACPYQAITKIIVPCENVCPVGAIQKDENGHAKIDFSKCIACGKCLSACPFGAVHEKCQILDVLKNIKAGKKVIAMLAPSIMGQMPCTPEQLKQGMLELGFYDVYEVAQGADVTSKTEAAEFEERLEDGAEFMTTSCCAAYNELVEKHIPEMKPFKSNTKTPLYYTAEIVKKEHPDAVTVFLTPCNAKRKEAMKNPNIDLAINFKELGAWMIAVNLQLDQCKEAKYNAEASAEGRNYAVTGGVAGAVQKLLPEHIPAYPVIINGLDKNSIKDLKKYAKNGVCELGNLVEVMSCQGGCLGGSGNFNPYKRALKKLGQYVEASTPEVELLDID